MLKHKKGLEIIQIWHASGATKKFGFQSLNKKEGRGSDFAKVMNMHKNYSHVMAPSKRTKKFYAQAFGIEENKIIIGLLPRIDYIRKSDNIKEKFLLEYPEKANKETILYVPTFRKDEQLDLTDLEQNINTKKYNLIISLHPLDKTKVNEQFIVNRVYNTFDLLKIADYIITDYSAVAFESCVLDKPLYFYVNDIDQYINDRGLNIDLFKEMPNATSKDIKEILKRIETENYDYNSLALFRENYMGNDFEDATIKLVNFIFNYLEVGNNVEFEKETNGPSKTKLNI